MEKKKILCSKHRSLEFKHDLEIRLNKLEGQLNGVRKMIEADRPCDDVIMQISAITSGIKAIGRQVIKDHINKYMADNLDKNKKQVTEDLLYLLNMQDK